MKYVDLHGNRIERTTGQDRFLSFLFQHAFTRFFMKLLSARWISRAAGWFMNRGVSRIFIRPFVKKNAIDLSDFEDRKYRSFNDFFTRAVRPEKRPVAADPDVFISPSDGKASVYEIEPGLEFTVKGSLYSVYDVLKDRELSERFLGGTAFVLRLSPDDYHRFHFPDDGTLLRRYFLPGKLYTVNLVVHEYRKVFHENCRSVSVLKTARFGTVAMVEVGALLVGRIENRDVTAFSRGEEKGRFLFGGSTILLFTEKGAVTPTRSLVRNTAEGYETLVHFGTGIGQGA